MQSKSKVSKNSFRILIQTLGFTLDVSLPHETNNKVYLVCKEQTRTRNMEIPRTPVAYLEYIKVIKLLFKY